MTESRSSGNRKEYLVYGEALLLDTKAWKTAPARKEISLTADILDKFELPDLAEAARAGVDFKIIPGSVNLKITSSEDPKYLMTSIFNPEFKSLALDVTMESWLQPALGLNFFSVAELKAKTQGSPKAQPFFEAFEHPVTDLAGKRLPKFLDSAAKAYRILDEFFAIFSSPSLPLVLRLVPAWVVPILTDKFETTQMLAGDTGQLRRLSKFSHLNVGPNELVEVIVVPKPVLMVAAKTCSEALKDLISQCLQHNPSVRVRALTVPTHILRVRSSKDWKLAKADLRFIDASRFDFDFPDRAQLLRLVSASADLQGVCLDDATGLSEEMVEKLFNTKKLVFISVRLLPFGQQLQRRHHRRCITNARDTDPAAYVSYHHYTYPIGWLLEDSEESD